MPATKRKKKAKSHRTAAQKEAAVRKARRTRAANIPRRAKRLGVSTAKYRKYLKEKAKLAKEMLG